jgi:hypothetical protein
MTKVKRKSKSSDAEKPAAKQTSADPATPGNSSEREHATEPERTDGRVVLQIRIRPALRREIKRLADDAGVTTQTYALLALREFGVTVTDDDLVDLRKGEHRALRSKSQNIADRSSATDPLNALLGLAPAAAAIASRDHGCRTATPGGLTLIINNYASKPDP